MIDNGEFSCKNWLSKIIKAYEGGFIAGFIVRANPSWYKWLNAEMPLKTPVVVSVEGCKLYAWRIKVKQDNVKNAYYISSMNVDVKEYVHRWSIEVLFRSGKSLMPKTCLRSVVARLFFFTICLIASIMLHSGFSLEAWRSCFIIYLFAGWFDRLLAFLTLSVYYYLLFMFYMLFLGFIFMFCLGFR